MSTTCTRTCGRGGLLVSEHISDRIADYLDGHLGPADRNALEEHVAECDECAADLAYVRDLRRRALDEGSMHLPATRLVDAVDGAVELDEHEERHLQACETCRREREWLLRQSELPASFEEPSAAKAGEPMVRPPTARRARRRWAGALTALAALVAGVMVFWPGSDESSRLADLARIEPLPVRLVRSSATEAFEVARMSGLESYRDGAWVTAREHFSRALELLPEAPEILLYRGSAALLSGAVDVALTDLAAVVDGADANGAVREEARWQLAQAFLLAGRSAQAETLLEELAAEAGRRAADARSLLEEADF